MSSKRGANFFRRTDVRLSLWYVITFLLSALIICGFLYIRIQSKFVKDIDRFLIDEIKELTDVLLGKWDERSIREFESSAKARTYYPLVFRVLGQSGYPLYTSEGFERIAYDTEDKVLENARNYKRTRVNVRSPEGNPYRVVSSPVFVGGRLSYIVQMATHLVFVEKSSLNLVWNIVAAVPIIVALGGAGGWWLARRSLSPLGYIAAKARSITSSNLSDRLAPRGTGDEMDVLIETINEMIARLETAFRRMTEFTADVSHELKTPLCAMRGEAEVLLSKGRDIEQYRDAFIHFIEQFDRLDRMINDMVLLSRADSAGEKFATEPVCLDGLLGDICDFFLPLAEQKGLSLLYGRLQSLTILGDRMRLQQLFTNLLDNAIKYTPQGTVEVRLERRGIFAVTQVIDSGIGIPKDEQEKIFERFYRVDKSRSRQTGGAGLGLSIARWIAEAHGGRIEVSSEQGRGSTFSVYLPLTIPQLK